ncbi:hypothetical protein ABZ816_15355 [Actinosynnema sp. NPDC047251]|uniref:MmyB-like transcription regulator ligand binding domain-containing protein n=1 Tax=Saccharothrix espanaensis (strain ATCC 51144 / DSM 44229 / JCM 9112 / NBRC 15066 / NRRL 15764) TaxID=1179773 RepID=K0JY39_SACES|nr:hypothetical protein [Saccharothrix espanaensis]CCH29604.1 hypothetical protein BN6_22840 [Saccharothrix espanaensis DSM 44229]
MTCSRAPPGSGGSPNEFGRRFTAATAVPDGTGVRSWRHPVAGVLDLAYESLTLPGDRVAADALAARLDVASQSVVRAVIGRPVTMAGRFVTRNPFG